MRPAPGIPDGRTLSVRPGAPRNMSQQTAPSAGAPGPNTTNGRPLPGPAERRHTHQSCWTMSAAWSSHWAYANGYAETCTVCAAWVSGRPCHPSTFFSALKNAVAE